MWLVLGFAELAGAALLLTAAITGDGLGDVIAGRAHVDDDQDAEDDSSSSATGTGTSSAGAAAAASLAGSGTSVPRTSWNPEGKPIADWIVPILQWASQHGWTGTVTSGWRSYGQQAAINASGAYSAAAGDSNHETSAYPGGAVDVTNPSQLIEVLKGWTGADKLVGGVLGAVDPEHFSATGH